MSKTTHGLDGQHQDVDRTLCGRVNQNAEDRDKWRKYVHSVANPRIEDGKRTEQNIPMGFLGFPLESHGNGNPILYIVSQTRNTTHRGQ